MEKDCYKETTMMDFLEQAREIQRRYCNINRITLGCTGCVYGDATDENYCSLARKPYIYDVNTEENVEKHLLETVRA